MSATLPFDWIDGHVVARHGERRILVDTGSPLTYAHDGGFDIGAISVPAQPVPPEIDAMLRNHLTVDVDMLLGMDVLAGVGVSIFSAERRIVLEDHTLEFTADASVALASEGGIPVVEVETDQALRVFLDTGAPLSYLPGPRMEDLGTRRDFYLGIGEFEVAVGMVDVRMADRTLRVESATPPPLLREVLAGLGIQGVLGTALLRTADIHLDSRSGRLGIRWHSGLLH